ncbi:DUF3147 family protein [Methylocaldum sp. BRCS4]|jgi:hypothetical protein|uniref:DUF3147 family protein n=1 Tax=Methylocaldum sp. 14B TaxID=1912213 RepID=UPI00098B179C|nr:DUF3147 family protein [Methylocaldum sp. 14B]MVF23069.1 DUF3147 family protein [Methylocaldum sp. BRCS4]
MLRLIIKTLLTAVVVVAVSETAKRSVWLGAILAALPLTSLLALTWFWVNTRDVRSVAGLAMGIFWAVIPSLAFFPLFAWFLRIGLPFLAALSLAGAATVSFYALYYLVLGYAGMRL